MVRRGEPVDMTTACQEAIYGISPPYCLFLFYLALANNTHIPWFPRVDYRD
ncbi:hypothetical protein V8F33_000850 [Rhypophila sp. PSN 637]